MFGLSGKAAVGLGIDIGSGSIRAVECAGKTSLTLSNYGELGAAPVLKAMHDPAAAAGHEDIEHDVAALVHQLQHRLVHTVERVATEIQTQSALVAGSAIRHARRWGFDIYYRKINRRDHTPVFCAAGNPIRSVTPGSMPRCDKRAVSCPR